MLQRGVEEEVQGGSGGGACDDVVLYVMYGWLFDVERVEHIVGGVAGLSCFMRFEVTGCLDVCIMVVHHSIRSHILLPTSAPLSARDCLCVLAGPPSVPLDAIA